MHIRMNVALAGSDRNGAWRVENDEVTDRIPVGEARRLVRVGLAAIAPAPAAAPDALRLIPHGGGWYVIEGPGLEEPLRLRGRAAAEEALAELSGQVDRP